MKRANRSGTVYKLSGKRRNPWIARLSQGYTKDGDRKWYTVGYYRTKTEAVLALDLARVQPLPERPNITLQEVFDEWKLSAYIDLSEKSKKMYDLSYSYLNALSEYKFTDLRTAHFQQIINSLKLSYSTLSKIKIVINLIYNYAITNDIVNKNYAQGIKLPKKRSSQKEIFSDIDINIICNNINIKWVDSVLILIYTGFRIQELLNITKFDVDLKENVIRGGLKTETGKNRFVPIHQKIRSFILQRYNNCNTFLFENDDGKQVSQDYYRRKIYKPLLEKLQIKYRSPHATRHTCVTLLARDGADMLAIKQILGHTNYAFTADTYTHENTDFLKQEMAKMK